MFVTFTSKTVMFFMIFFNSEDILKAFIDLIQLHLLFFFNTLTVTFFKKNITVLRNIIFPVMFVNVSLAMFLKCFLRFQHFEPHVS